ncbi:hypothetical protein [Nannocystis pusilla]|uniref:Histone n=1 Tax=Nannocystis pusilla TaxID=889268 RepID=A0ABS7U4S6_9BACT|nr:hypothetical protein [Nannocystis pusilla]MBZ5715276.1 hypothetical protein [Nannocystis pusilla]
MPKRKISPSNKRRILLAAKARYERAAAKAAAALEACMSCSTDKLKKGLAGIEADGEKERKALLARLGLSERDASELLSGRSVAGKKASKKKTSKKAAAAAAPAKKASKKKASKKKASKKKTSKKKTAKKKASKKG